MARKINSLEKDELLRWFLNHMPQEQRGELMATFPRHYARLYPSVSSEVISTKVMQKLDEQKETEKDPVPYNSPVL